MASLTAAVVPGYPGRELRICVQYVLALLGPASESLAPALAREQLLELQRLLAGQALNGAGRMTLAVAQQWLRDQAEEEVP